MEAPTGFLKKANEATKWSQDGQEVKLQCNSAQKIELNVLLFFIPPSAGTFASHHSRLIHHQ